MPAKRPPSPREKLKVRPATPKALQKGDEIVLRATVTRTGRNSWDTADTVTLRIPGFATPVTIDAKYLEGED